MFLAFMVGTIWFGRRYQQHKPRAFDFNEAIAELRASQDFAGAIISDDNTPVELQRRQIKVVEAIGSGQFGDVMKAWKINYKGGAVDAAQVHSGVGKTEKFLVAVKVLRDVGIDRELAESELKKEALVMAQLPENANIVGGSHIDLDRAPYVVYGVQYIDPVSLDACARFFV